MDVLSDTIAALRTGRPGSGLTVRHAPWGREYRSVSGAGFHLVLDGSCWLVPRRSEPVPLAVGDVVLLYRDVGHGLADRPDTPLSEVAAPGEPTVVAGPGARTALLCGVYEFAHDWTHPLLDGLPDVVHVPAGTDPQVTATVGLLTAELAADADRRPGADALTPALLDALLVYVLRAWLAAHADHGWGTALHDPAVARALDTMHAEPAHPWTVGELGAAAGMSRATFARRFTGSVGEPPLAYLTRWRMITAARALRDTDAPLAAIARTVGYSSEYAFAKAFKRAHGTAPGQYRRRG